MRRDRRAGGEASPAYGTTPSHCSQSGGLVPSSRAGRPRSGGQRRTKVEARATCPRTACSAVNPRDASLLGTRLFPARPRLWTAELLAHTKQTPSHWVQHGFRCAVRGQDALGTTSNEGRLEGILPSAARSAVVPRNGRPSAKRLYLACRRGRTFGGGNFRGINFQVVESKANSKISSRARRPLRGNSFDSRRGRDALEPTFVRRYSFGSRASCPRSEPRDLTKGVSVWFAPSSP